MSSIAQSFNKDSAKRLATSIILSSKAAKLTSWILILLIIYLIAMFGWGIWDQFQPRQAIAVQSTSKKVNSSTVNIRQLTRLNIFGDPSVDTTTSTSDELDAPVTRLQLKLRGVYATDDDQLSGAMIEAKNKQDVYRIGSKLPGATGLKLHKILSDRVIMSRNGKYETLMIEDFGQLNGSSKNQSKTSRTSNIISRNSANNTSSNIIDKRKDAKLSSELIKLRTKLTDPQSLSELVSVTAAMEGEQFKGFRIAPGKNRALFGRMGLRRNDIVTSVNGISLDDPASAFSLMEQISTADEIDLTIKRGNRDMNILFSAKPE